MHEDIICDQNQHDIRDQHPEKALRSHTKKPIAGSIFMGAFGSEEPKSVIVFYVKGQGLNFFISRATWLGDQILGAVASNLLYGLQNVCVLELFRQVILPIFAALRAANSYSSQKEIVGCGYK